MDSELEHSKEMAEFPPPTHSWLRNLFPPIATFLDPSWCPAQPSLAAYFTQLVRHGYSSCLVLGLAADAVNMVILDWLIGKGCGVE